MYLPNLYLKMHLIKVWLVSKAYKISKVYFDGWIAPKQGMIKILNVMDYEYPNHLLLHVPSFSFCSML